MDDAPVVAPVFTKRLRRVPLPSLHKDDDDGGDGDDAVTGGGGGGSVVFRPRRCAQARPLSTAAGAGDDAGETVRRPARLLPSSAGSRTTSTQTGTSFVKRRIARPQNLASLRDRDRDSSGEESEQRTNARRGVSTDEDGGSYSASQLAQLRANTADLSTRPPSRTRDTHPPGPTAPTPPARDTRRAEEKAKAEALALAEAQSEVEARAAAAKAKWARQAVWDLPTTADTAADSEADTEMDRDDRDDRDGEAEYISLNAKSIADRHAGLGYTAPAVYDDILDDATHDDDEDGVVQDEGEYGDGRLPVGDAARAASDRRRRAEMADLLRTAQQSESSSDSDRGPGGGGGKAAAGHEDEDDDSTRTSDDDWEQTQLDRMTGVRRTTARLDNDDYNDDGGGGGGVGGTDDVYRSSKHSLAAQRRARRERRELERPIPTLDEAISRAEEAVAGILLDAAPKRQRREVLLEQKAEIERQKEALQRDIADADRQALEVLRVYAPEVYDELVQSGRYKAD